MFSRLGRGILSLLIVWCVLSIMGTPAVSEAMRRAYSRLAELRSGSPSESALSALIIDEQALYRPACSGPVCTASTMALDGYRLGQIPDATFGWVKLMLEPSQTLEAAPGNHFTHVRRFAVSRIFSAKDRAADGRVHILDEVLPSGETQPVFATEEGFFVAWERSDDGDAEPAAYQNVGSRRNSDAGWRGVVYQPLSRPLKLAVTGLASRVDVGDWVVLYTHLPRIPNASPELRDMMLGRVSRVGPEMNGTIIEMETAGDRGDSFEWWLSRRLVDPDLQAQIAKLADEGMLMMTFKPDASEAATGNPLSAGHARGLYERRNTTTLRRVPRSALDRGCSVDRAPQTACVWMLLDVGEPVPVQVGVVDLGDGNVGVFERRVFAGKGIAPQTWQRLPALTRRAWLMQLSKDNASIWDDGKVLATPWRH